MEFIGFLRFYVYFIGNDVANLNYNPNQCHPLNRGWPFSGVNRTRQAQKFGMKDGHPVCKGGWWAAFVDIISHRLYNYLSEPYLKHETFFTVHRPARLLVRPVLQGFW